MRKRSKQFAKFTPPRLANVYLRKLLLRKISDSTRPVLWVSGPPGAGKTTLISSYFRRHAAHALWYQMDKGDADAASFFYYLGLAVQALMPRAKNPLPRYTPEQNLLIFTRRYFQELCNQCLVSRQRFILVFDDYQEITGGGDCEKVVGEMLRSVPAGIKLIIISRTSPPALYAGLLARELLDIIDWEDLRLGLQETRELVQQYHVPITDSEVMASLHQATSGWAAGITLLLQEAILKQKTVVQANLYTPENAEKVFTYFSSEVFTTITPTVRKFLCQTAMLPSMTVSMAKDLTGVATAQKILDTLCYRHFFIGAKTSASGNIYEYHSLFRSYLLKQAEELFGAAELKRLRRRAAHLLEQAGSLEEALALFQEAEDWQSSTAIILKQAPEMLAQGRYQTLRQWIMRLPPSLIADTAWLQYWLGCCRLSFDPHAARTHFREALALLKANQDAAGVYLAWCGIVESFFYLWADFTEITVWIDTLAELRRLYPEYPAPEIGARVTVNMMTGLMFRQPIHADLHTWVEEAEKYLADADINKPLRVFIGSQLLLYRSWIGNAPRMIHTAELLQGVAKDAELPPLIYLAYKGMLGVYLWFDPIENHQLCLQTVQEGLHVAQETGVHIWDALLLSQAAYTCIYNEEHDSAADYLQRLLLALDHSRHLDTSHYHFIAGKLAFARKDLDKALEHGQISLQETRRLNVSFPEALSACLVAQVLLAQRRYEEVNELIDCVGRIGKNMESDALQYLTLLLKADLNLALQQDSAGLEYLGEALHFMRRHQVWTQEYSVRYDRLAYLYARALDAGVETFYVESLIRKNPLLQRYAPPDSLAWPYPIKIFTLGQFQIVHEGRPLVLPERPLQLLRTIIALGGDKVKVEYLCQHLWLEADGDMAYQALEVTLHRLRKLLGSSDSILLQAGHLSLNPRLCWLDVWTLERLLGRLGEALAAPASDHALAQLYGRVIRLYKAPFLMQESDCPTVIGLRERLSTKFCRQMAALGQFWEQTGRWDKAEDCYTHALAAECAAELLYQRLMLCYHRQGRHAEAALLYERCRHALLHQAGIGPSPQTEAIYLSLRP